MFPKTLEIIFQRVSNIKFSQGSMPWTPLKGYFPLQHAMLVTCIWKHNLVCSAGFLLGQANVISLALFI